MKRSGKFYRKDERDTMKALGFRPTWNSGSGPLQKEDGENGFALCQLKSTDKTQITLKLLDFQKLAHNALMSRKIPVFAFKFLSTGETWVCIRPEDAAAVSEFLKTGVFEKPEKPVRIKTKREEKETVTASLPEERERFYEERRKRDWKRKSCRP